MIRRELVRARDYLKRNQAVILGALFAIVVANALVTWHALTEKTVYYWDYSYYWTSAVDLAHRFGSPSDVWRELVKSLSTDYNYTPILLVSFVMHFLGDSRAVYYLAIVNLYAVPVVAIAIYLFSKAVKKQPNKAVYISAAFTLLLLSPAVLIPILEGLPDIFGLLPIMLFLFVLYHTKAFSRFDTRVLLLGVLLFLILISRRWYAFWVVGSAVGLSLGVAWTLLRQNKWKIDKKLLQSTKWPIINGIVVLAVAVSLLALLTPYVLEAYRTDYGDMYDAYKVGGKVDSIKSAVLYFGLSTLALSAAGYAQSFADKRLRQFIPISLFFSVGPVVTFILFIRIQGFTSHHYYLLVPAILYGLLILVYGALNTRRIDRRISLAAVLLFPIALAVFAFVAPITYSKPLQYAFGQTWRPMVRKDLDVLKSMVSDTEEGNANATIYVVSSSHMFNSEILANINQPSQPRNANVLEAASLDKRDGFPNKFFTADYIVVTTPVQVHLPTGQMVVTVLNEAVLNGKAKNLLKIGTYMLDNNIEAAVYKRIAPYDQEFIDYLRAIFTAQYGSDYPSLTNIEAE